MELKVMLYIMLGLLVALAVCFYLLEVTKLSMAKCVIVSYKAQHAIAIGEIAMAVLEEMKKPAEEIDLEKIFTVVESHKEMEDISADCDALRMDKFEATLEKECNHE